MCYKGCELINVGHLTHERTVTLNLINENRLLKARGLVLVSWKSVHNSIARLDVFLAVLHLLYASYQAYNGLHV